MDANGYNLVRIAWQARRRDELIEDLLREQRENTRTILFLARLLGKTLGERDRARGTAVTLEHDLAVLLDDHYGPKGRGDD